MQFIKATFIITTFLMCACVAPEEAPEGILSEAQMVDILVDIHLAEGIKQTGETTIDRTKLQIADMYQAIFDHYGITAEEFRKSYDWYSRRELIFDNVYEKVIERLNSMTPADLETEAAEIPQEPS